jgi:lipopolysaccharide export system ATP-binding protein
LKEVLKAGVPEELVEDEMVRRVYLGQNFELRKRRYSLKGNQ